MTTLPPITIPEDRILARVVDKLVALSRRETDVEQSVGLLDLATTLGKVRAGQTYPGLGADPEKAIRSLSSTATLFERHGHGYPVVIDGLRGLADRLAEDVRRAVTP